jgi:hypothetical protein
MKTYVITLAKVFPSGHPRAGEPTLFRSKVEAAVNGLLGQWRKKIHTIRGNYPLWQKRFEQINDGKACLSIREWSGKPYHSKQVEIARLTKEDGIGLQKLTFSNMYGLLGASAWIDDKFTLKDTLAFNDGLTFDDWFDWFKGLYHFDLAIIHFTKFRYS